MRKYYEVVITNGVVSEFKLVPYEMAADKQQAEVMVSGLLNGSWNVVEGQTVITLA